MDRIDSLLPDAGKAMSGSSGKRNKREAGAEVLRLDDKICPHCGRELQAEWDEFPPALQKKYGKPGEWYYHPCTPECEKKNERPREDELPDRDVEVIRAEPAGVSADDYFRFMGSLPAPHILEFLNGYCGRDGLTPDAVREALKIASERDARRVGYVRSILERWVERGVKTVGDVERFEQDRKLRLVEQSGAVRGGALRIGEARKGVSGGPDRQSAARRREGYEWLFGETE